MINPVIICIYNYLKSVKNKVFALPSAIALIYGIDCHIFLCFVMLRSCKSFHSCFQLGGLCGFEFDD